MGDDHNWSTERGGKDPLDRAIRPPPDLGCSFPCRPIRLLPTGDRGRDEREAPLEGCPFEPLRGTDVDLDQVRVDHRIEAERELDRRRCLARPTGRADEEPHRVAIAASARRRLALAQLRDDLVRKIARHSATDGREWGVGAAAPSSTGPARRSMTNEHDGVGDRPRRMHARIRRGHGRCEAHRSAPGGNASARPATMNQASSESATSC